MTTILQENEIKECVVINSQLIPIIEDAFVSLTKDLTTMPPIMRSVSYTHLTLPTKA